MSTVNPTFKTKQDRDEFFIALGVIALFMLFFWGVFGRGDAPQPPTEAVVVAVDSDGDGVADDEDDCPEIAGILLNNGCPKVIDTDGDGIADKDDLCPEYAGTERLKGCPGDKDKDGVHNGIDKCPDSVGAVDKNGCAVDTDGDGVADIKDKCPKVKGIVANKGCPKIKIDKADMVILNEAMRSVQFETGKASLKASSFKTLDQIVGMMKKYPKYKLAIGGHTDNTGDAKNNLTLSKARALTCYDYLMSKGVPRNKLSHNGFGMRKPLVPNDTSEGRQTNRRVEFKFNY